MWPSYVGGRVMMDVILGTSQLMQGGQWPGTVHAYYHKQRSSVLKGNGCHSDDNTQKCVTPLVAMMESYGF